MLGKRLCLFVTFLFFVQFAHGQLTNFTLNVVKTNETCTSNGTLTFTVSNTTSGSTILYSIFLLPNVTTPISVQSATSISGLVAGTYRIVATQSLGSQSGSQQQDITIDNSITPLTYQLTSTNEVCGNDGAITVNVTAGTPLNYEIFAGPMTRPLQTSNVFSGLTAGIYQIRVFDVCHQGVVQTYTVQSSDIRLTVTLSNPVIASCTSVNVGFNIQTVVAAPIGIVKYPLQVTTTVFPQSGPTVAYNQTINSGVSFLQQIPLYSNQPYNYSFTITDGCGTVYNLNGIIQNLNLGAATYVVAPQDCTHKNLTFSNVTSLSLITAPSGYSATLPLNFTSQIANNTVNVNGLIGGTYVFMATDLCGLSVQFVVNIVIDNNATPPFYSLSNRTCIDATLFIYEITQLVMVSAPASYAVALPHDYTSSINSAHYAAFVHLPIGNYVFNVLDQCGNSIIIPVIIDPVSTTPVVAVLEGCQNNEGSLQITGEFTAISLISAPTAYTTSLPVNLLTSVLLNGTKLSLGSLSPGNYVFQSTNSCNESFTTNVTILGYQQTTNITVTPNCGSYNLQLNHASNNNNSVGFWLQKYNPLTSNWVHPLTNAVYINGTLPTASNSVLLNNNVVNYNLAFSGHFRILKSMLVYVNGTLQALNCFKIINEFDFSGEPKINDVFSVSCGLTFEVIVNAEGNSALIYRITTMNNQPFLIENGGSSLFSGLAPAIYNFQVEDVCGNRVNSQFEVLNPNPMEIDAELSCDGESTSLTAPNFSFLTYQWWKDNNPTTILSTTNSLVFPLFNSVLNSGIYHVRISYVGNPNSCLNQILDYSIPGNNTPHAGNDNSVAYCGRQGIIDMTTLLSGTFDSSGTWSEISSSGMLTDNLWDSSNVPYATYQFKYRVDETCNLFDEVLINVTINAIPQIPIASFDPIVCETQNLNLFSTTIPNGTNHWTGPNGFTSALQNPILNSISDNENGTYTVYTTRNNCQSGESSVTVLIHPLPSFELNQDCVGNDYQIWVTKLNEFSFDETNSTFSWTGPNNFVANQNLITITGGELGIYSLKIANQFGCETTKTIDVIRSNCFIPNVITPNNDNLNENLNLIGFDVAKLEVYNRWGKKVYEKTNYLDEWHGQNMNGNLLPDSTYYYIIKMSTTEIKTGWIFLSKG